MKLRLYKFQIVPICQVVNEEGRVVGEKPVTQSGGVPLEVFGVEGLREWAGEFEKEIEQWEEPAA